MNPEQPNRRNQPPAANNPFASGAIIAVSIIAATAFAVYESPEVRQFAENLRRQIARSLRNLGDNIDPADRRRRTEDPFAGQPLFNRPEDAEGVEVDADEESARRQREELEFWNKQREAERVKKEGVGAEAGPSERERRSSFGDFLQKDHDGQYVHRSGAEPVQTEGLTQRRGVASGSMFGNPFGDEHGIELESQDGSAGASGWLGAERVDLSKSLITPSKEETPDDIKSDGLYSASERRFPASKPGLVSSAQWEDAMTEALNDSGPVVATADPLIDISEPFDPNSPKEDKKDEEEEFATSAHIVRPEDDEAFAAIHAWNESASTSSLNHSTSDGTVQNFYSMPTTPKVSSESGDLVDSVMTAGSAQTPAAVNDSATVVAEDSNTEGWSDDEGMATPKTMGSMSIIGDQESFGGSEDGRLTPGSWTEVGSQVSGDDVRQPTQERL